MWPTTCLRGLLNYVMSFQPDVIFDVTSTASWPRDQRDVINKVWRKPSTDHCYRSLTVATVYLPLLPYTYLYYCLLINPTVCWSLLPFTDQCYFSLTIATIYLSLLPFSFHCWRALTFATINLPLAELICHNYYLFTTAPVNPPVLPFTYHCFRVLTITTVYSPLPPFTYHCYSLLLSRGDPV